MVEQPLEDHGPCCNGIPDAASRHRVSDITGAGDRADSAERRRTFEWRSIVTDAANEGIDTARELRWDDAGSNDTLEDGT